MSEGQQSVATGASNPVPTGFDALPVLDVSNPNFTRDGNRLLAELRTKGPVCRVEPIGVIGFLKWADCDGILRDFRTFSAAFERSKPVPGAEEETKIDTLLREDPPKHTRVRALMQQAFTPERVAAMEPHTREIARKLIDDILAKGAECDFLHGFALPLPSTVMSGLLGVDASMVETFSRWANSMMGGNTAHAIKDEAARKKRYEEIARDAKDMEAFLKEKIEERRKTPGQDLVTYLIQAAEGGDKLTDREALTLMKLAMIAGNDLTTQAIALTLDCLLENPEQMRLVSNDLSLASHAFEEALRYNGPVVFLQRKALRDADVAGVKVPAGCVVAPLVSSANHDEAVFENPEVFDIRRTIPRVLSMSSGNHQCIGQPLARLEARVAFEEWFARVTSFARNAPPQFTRQMGLRGFDQLPVTLERRPAKAAAPAPEDSVVKQAATAEKLAAMSDKELGLDKRQIMSVRVAQIWQASTTTKVFALTHPTGGLLPKFTPGSHIVVHMRDGGKVFRNSYSLINGGYNQSLGYFIGVQLAQNSKGGSKYLHEKVTRGGELTISVPANCFPAAESAVKHLLIAGGIGITPLLAHRTHLKLNEQRVELHYTFRNAKSAAFVPFLGFQNDPNVHLYDDSLGQKLDIPSLIRRQPEGTHLYTCGPPGLMDAAINAAEALGWPPESIHVERFGAETHKGDEPFDAVCQNAGKTVKVGAAEHLLDCLEHAGIEVPFGCRAGSCGTCEVGVLSGKIIHRDSVLSAAERAEGKKMLVCVSRGQGPLTLSL